MLYREIGRSALALTWMTTCRSRSSFTSSRRSFASGAWANWSPRRLPPSLLVQGPVVVQVLDFDPVSLEAIPIRPFQVLLVELEDPLLAALEVLLVPVEDLRDMIDLLFV